MNTALLILLWLAPALCVMCVNHVRVRSAIRRRNHDRILYALCNVRDFMAVKSARGELSESSEVFKYFFGVIADIVHVHKNHPLCFRHLAAGVKENRHQTVPTWKRRLMREIRKSDAETRLVFGEYLRALQIAMHEDKRIAFIERTWFKLSRSRVDIFKAVARQSVLSHDTRTLARFAASIRFASQIDDLELAAA